MFSLPTLKPVHFFYKQPVYEQLDFGKYLVKQLLGLNHLQYATI